MGFGTALDMDGSTLAIGCPTEGTGRFDYVFVYYNDGSGWTEQAGLTLLTGQTFGASVAVAEDYLAMGVPGADEPTFDEGAVLLHKRTGSTWSFDSKITQHNASFGDGFGFSVDMTANFLISGALYANGVKGEAWIFENQAGTWVQNADLTPADLQLNNEFGAAVAINDEYAAVGAPSSVSNGFVYVFQRQGTNWNQISKLVPNDSTEGDKFGTSVALNEEFLLVGASDHGNLSNRRPGRAYLYQLNGTNVDLSVNMWPGDPYYEYEYGRHVALSQTYGMAGASTAPEAYVLYLPLIPVLEGMWITSDMLVLNLTNLNPGTTYEILSSSNLISQNWIPADTIVSMNRWAYWTNSPDWDPELIFRLATP